MQDKPAYTPINCSYYDELEALATLKKPTQIVYRPSGDSDQETIQGVIKTFIIKEKIEYLQLTDGQEIRLDWLIEVDGKPLPNAC